MASSYNTGGVVKPTHSGNGADASDCNVIAASEGNANGPNAKKWAQSPQ